KVLLEAVNLKSDDNSNIQVQAKNGIDSLAVIDVSYKDVQTKSKDFLSSSLNRDMTYNEKVISTNLNSKNIYLISENNNINLEATNLNASGEKKAIIVNKNGDVNILAKEYKVGELHHSKKSSLGGLLKSESTYEKDHLKIKSSKINPSNTIIVANNLNIQGTQLNTKDIKLDVNKVNLISVNTQIKVEY
ncbi:MAG: hypothetical protein CSA86_06290, partial [Arcobacter sp.]